MNERKKIGNVCIIIFFSKLKTTLRNELSMADSSRTREKLIEAEAEVSNLRNEI